MTTKDRKQQIRQRLEEEEPNASPKVRQAVAREMNRLLESDLLEEDLEDQSVDVEYLISRLEVREGDDNPSLKIKWNHWIGEMDAFFAGEYSGYKINSDYSGNSWLK